MIRSRLVFAVVFGVLVLLVSPHGLAAGQEASEGERGASSALPSADELGARIQEFDALFDEANRLSGVLLIARGDDVLHREAYGLAHRGLGVENTPETRFCIASITKIMTTIVVNQLLADGLVTVDDTISKFIPGFPRGDEITLVHLARHRAGIPHRLTTNAQEALPLSAADVAAMMGEDQFVSDPGEQSAYSSAGYTVLARCLEVAAGKPLRELLAERIFEPAGMTGAIDPAPGRGVEGAACSYVPGRGELWPAPPKDMAFLAGAGSVYSTADDLLAMLRACKEGLLGVALNAFLRNGQLRWMGASNGFFAYVLYFAEADTAVIWAGNSWGGCAGALLDRWEALLAGEEITAPETPEFTATPPVQELKEYTGEYVSRPGATNKVRVLGDELWFADSMVLATGPDTFWHQPWQAELTFERDEEGRVVSVRRGEGEDASTWPKSAADSGESGGSDS